MLTIATRGSMLALRQAETIRTALLTASPGLAGIELLIVKTRGDLIHNAPTATIGGKGLFVKEIEEALLDGRADLAIHSMKDMPAELPRGLILGSVPQREDPRDVLLTQRFASLEALPAGARVGTGSLRRQALLRALRPDLAATPLRGNVDTRLNKLLEGGLDAVIVAAAGLNRLGLAAPHCIHLPAGHFIPAAGQGALGIEYREDDHELAAITAPLDHPATRVCVEAERAFLAGLGGNCHMPIAAHAVMTGEDSLSITGLLMDPQGERVVRRQAGGHVNNARAIGFSLAHAVKDAGGAAVLAEVRGLA